MIVRIEARLIDEALVIESIPILRDAERTYETVSMFKGIEATTKKNRRIYKSDINRSKVACNVLELIPLENILICYVYVHHDEKDKYMASIRAEAVGYLEAAYNMAIDFIDKKETIIS